MTRPQPTASGDVEALVKALVSASWPDGGHDGFPTQRIAEMLATHILASDWLAAYVQAAREIADEEGCMPGSEWMKTREADLQAARDEERARVLGEFAQWVATNRAYNGSEHLHGQSLYNECLNAVLSTWAWEFVREARSGARRVTCSHRNPRECADYGCDGTEARGGAR